MKSLSLKLCFLACILLVPLSSQARYFPDTFDDILKESAARYLPEYHWLWWKSQVYQESLLNPMAVSHAGAQGLAQIMPGTWAEQTRIMGINASPFNPRANVHVGAAYMRRMLRVWKAERPADDRLRWGQGAYNCGAGCILRAQKKANHSTLWVDVAPFVPHETREYVARIERWHGEMQ